MIKHGLDNICVDIAKVLLGELKASPDYASLTYGELAGRLGVNITPRNLDKPLTQLSDFCVLYGMPPISAIVVGQDTLMPGKGYFEKYLPDTDEKGRKAAYKKHVGEVRSYENWPRLANLLGI